MAAEGVRPGGGRNPLPFSDGGGFTGMSGSRFARFWLLKPEIYPLFATLGLATGVCLYAISREFSSNPKYTIMPTKRSTQAIHETEADGVHFTSNRLIPHSKSSVTLFPFNFKPIRTLERYEGGNCE
eukprot:CAMPEP_0119413108 /NCGR_PEP_ID=MMETSP1335-20130426/5303_1 /TAXON_ID=259385 /ORGANISM="Chrysoculter rhomboideus, Strain RCC1486" /LENGTH=126 /DNA_ID=CAMNT_0007437887 /DNA_START=51 /DNA_END=431 /DNA_ORIENTATION=+